MKKKHEGLDLAGIYIIYLASILQIVFYAFVLDSWVSDFVYAFAIIYIVIAGLAILFTSAYHFGNFDNFILIAVLGIFVSIIGGILIYLGNRQRNVRVEDVKSFKENNDIERKLEQLDSLYNRNLITKDEYESKRKSIIDSF